MTQKEKDIKRLIKHISCEDVVPFLGSGFSLKAGAPSVWNLKEAIVRDGGEDFAEEVGDIKKISLADLSEKHVKYNGGSRNALMALLKRMFEIEPTDTSDHAFLRLIPHFKSIYTTNYETFIESAYSISELHVVNSNESFSFDGSKAISLYKIHGDLSTLSSPDSVVITTSDYKAYFKGKRFENLWTQFKNDAGKKTVLFIGYSLEDPNILNIIKNTRNLCGGSAKEWFLVAPGLNEYRINQLKHQKVTYIDAKAEEILPIILDTLKDTIDKDYKHKKVSTETFSKFCELNGQFRPQTIVGDEENEVTQYNLVPGTAFKHELKMGLPGLIDFINPSAYTATMPFGNTLFKIPAICVPSSQMKTFVYQLNSITLAHKEDISNVFIGPSVASLEWTLKLPSVHFKEKVKGCRYTLGREIHIQLQTPLYIIHMSGNPNDGWSIKYDFNVPTPSLHEALKWIHFLIASCEEKRMDIENNTFVSTDNMESLLKEFYKINNYFEALEELEYDHNVEFKQIEPYSEPNLYKVLILRSYYSGQFVSFPFIEAGDYVLKIDKIRLGRDISELHEVPFKLVRWNKLGKIKFCGKEFTLQTVLSVYDNMVISDCDPIDGENQVYLTRFSVSTATREIYVTDSLPDVISNKFESDEDKSEGVALLFSDGGIEDTNILDKERKELRYSENELANEKSNDNARTNI